jgi:hypothetical protein
MFLASVKSVPNVVHHRVKSIFGTSSVIDDVNRLDTAVFGISVERFEVKHTQIRVCANEGVPGSHILTCWESV